LRFRPPIGNPGTFSQWPPDIRIVAKWMAFFVAILYARWAVSFTWNLGGIFKIEDGFIIGGDFVNYWSAARLTLHHHVMNLFDIDGYHQALEILFARTIPLFYNWSYPPHFLPWILWLGLLPYPVALAFWLVVTFACYAFAVAYKRPQPWALALVLALSPASYANFSAGQNGYLSAALVVGGLRLLSVQPVVAGILFGSLSYKPQLGVLIPVALLAARQWRAFSAATVTVFVLVGLSICLFGVEPWLAYLKTVIPFQQTMLEMNPHTLFTRMILSPFMAARILGAPLSVAYSITAATTLGAVVAVVYAFKRCPLIELRNAILLTASFLASPYIFFYDMPILNAGIVGTVAAAGPSLKARSLLLLMAAYCLPLAVFPLNKAGIPIAPLIVAGLLGMQLSLMKSNQINRVVQI
jgi:uncharacterized membrane protein YiaA